MRWRWNTRFSTEILDECIHSHINHTRITAMKRSFCTRSYTCSETISSVSLYTAIYPRSISHYINRIHINRIRLPFKWGALLHRSALWCLFCIQQREIYSLEAIVTCGDRGTNKCMESQYSELTLRQLGDGPGIANMGWIAVHLPRHIVWRTKIAEIDQLDIERILRVTCNADGVANW